MRNFLLLIVLFFVTQWLLKKLRRANERGHAGTRSTSNGASTAAGGAGARNGAARRDPPQLADPLVRCAQCGVHTPTSESIVAAGQQFCCAEHARRHAARPSGRDAR
ncbi:PP0621 family protein [Caballeronia sp. LZ062]|uniref:PP0621 family protein n=1 Tax=unclassified Caballeronia TaxID=2646786 RepID=UPI00285DB5B3|nr:MULTISPECIES: PP0621 family protein [unclassified Caballeronia]MDR5855433.1 PP0621 family protein [Caballeronia sp. LZ050]MDR5870039.1 PP0621 family protein [Caballeronia sp. LZ062]